MNTKPQPAIRGRKIEWMLLILCGFMTLGPLPGHAGVKDPDVYLDGPGASYKGRDGAAEAKKDIASGNPRLMTYGLPAPSMEEFSVLLYAKLGISCHMIAGCVVTDDLIKYARDYNGVITKYAEKKFGAGIISKIMEEASQLYLKHPPMDRHWPDKHPVPKSPAS